MYEKQIIIVSQIIQLLQNVIKSTKIMSNKYDINMIIYSINIVLQRAYDRIEKIYCKYILKPDLENLIYNDNKLSLAHSK